MDSFFNSYGAFVATISGLIAAIGWSSLMSGLISVLSIAYLGISVILRFREFAKRVHEDWEAHKEHVRNRVKEHQDNIKNSLK